MEVASLLSDETVFFRPLVCMFAACRHVFNASTAAWVVPFVVLRRFCPAVLHGDPPCAVSVVCCMFDAQLFGQPHESLHASPPSRCRCRVWRRLTLQLISSFLCSLPVLPRCLSSFPLFPSYASALRSSCSSSVSFRVRYLRFSC
jgi:hypothetical protein